MDTIAPVLLYIAVFFAVVVAAIAGLVLTLLLECISVRTAELLCGAITIAAHGWIGSYFAPAALDILAEHGAPYWAPWVTIVLYALGAVLSYRGMLPLQAVAYHYRDSSSELKSESVEADRQPSDSNVVVAVCDVGKTR